MITRLNSPILNPIRGYRHLLPMVAAMLIVVNDTSRQTAALVRDEVIVRITDEERPPC